MSQVNDVSVECDVLVLGGGPGGYSAAFRSADLGQKTLLVERYATLGGVCLNVGCIPSKALLHIAAVMEEVPHLAAMGIEFGVGQVDLGTLRRHKEAVVDTLTSGLAGMAKGRKVEVVRGVGRFLDPHHLEVSLCSGTGLELTGEKQVIRFKQCVIAAGSQPMTLPFMPDDPRIVDSTGALELKAVPKRMLVVGGGIIGLEMATVYSALGARIDVVERLDGLMQGPDRDLVKVWEQYNHPRFERVMVNTRTVSAEASEQGIWVTFDVSRHLPSRSVMTWCWSRSGANPMATGSALTRPVSMWMSAGLSASTSRCAALCRTSSRSVTLLASPCWHTKPCTKAMSPPKWRRVRP